MVFIIEVKAKEDTMSLQYQLADEIDIIVAIDKTGDYVTLQAAINTDFIPVGVYIYIVSFDNHIHTGELLKFNIHSSF